MLGKGVPGPEYRGEIGNSSVVWGRWAACGPGTLSSSSPHLQSGVGISRARGALRHSDSPPLALGHFFIKYFFLLTVICLIIILNSSKIGKNLTENIFCIIQLSTIYFLHFCSESVMETLWWVILLWITSWQGSYFQYIIPASKYENKQIECFPTFFLLFSMLCKS